MHEDDFIAERRDRERMNEEREVKPKVTSLKLQLESGELAHYEVKDSRLSQQQLFEGIVSPLSS